MSLEGLRCFPFADPGAIPVNITVHIKVVQNSPANIFVNLTQWTLRKKRALVPNKEHLLDQGCQTHFHQGPHQPHSCLQRAECNFRTA